jgi:hypothetical protein
MAITDIKMFFTQAAPTPYDTPVRFGPRRKETGR